MESRYIAATIVIIVTVLYLAGGSLSERCVDIEGCRQCWKSTSTAVQSDLCANGTTCLAQPWQQQNNAVVDSLLCACAKAESENYANTATNSGIENTVSDYIGFNATVAEICSQTGLFLTKTNYG